MLPLTSDRRISSSWWRRAPEVSQGEAPLDGQLLCSVPERLDCECIRYPSYVDRSAMIPVHRTDGLWVRVRVLNESVVRLPSQTNPLIYGHKVYIPTD